MLSSDVVKTMPQNYMYSKPWWLLEVGAEQTTLSGNDLRLHYCHDHSYPKISFAIWYMYNHRKGLQVAMSQNQSSKNPKLFPYEHFLKIFICVQRNINKFYPGFPNFTQEMCSRPIGQLNRMSQTLSSRAYQRLTTWYIIMILAQ